MSSILLSKNEARLRPAFIDDWNHNTEKPGRMQPNKIECQSVLRQLEMRLVMCDQKMSPYIVDRFSLQYNTEHRRGCWAIF